MENIRKYYSSLVNHLRVEEQKLQQEQKILEQQNEESVNQEKQNET